MDRRTHQDGAEPDAAPLAPPLEVARWFNVTTPPTQADLVGRVVALHVFQLLCPGCVFHGLPQAQRLARIFPSDALQVIGLHSVFEHHDAMTDVVLEAFLHENRISFPVAVDRPDGKGGLPATMRRWGFRGTPTLVLIDRQGRIRHHGFGQEDDLAVGAAIGALLAEGP
ncbi:MAG: TlpA family protein disulfide reductase [Alphaproteobacteria bacterium]|nr:TlpA family protein disulfide reductase [Alphaproteobacteria bacterium]